MGTQGCCWIATDSPRMHCMPTNTAVVLFIFTFTNAGRADQEATAQAQRQGRRISRSHTN